MSDKKIILLTEGPAATQAVLAALRENPDMMGVDVEIEVLDGQSVESLGHGLNPHAHGSWGEMVGEMTAKGLRVEVGNDHMREIAHFDETKFLKLTDHVDDADRRPRFLKGAGARITSMQMKNKR